eukprot:Rmarinus@m.24959
MWESVACVDFKFVDDGGGNWSSASSVGDIRVGGHVFDGRKVPGTPTKIAHGFFPPPNVSRFCMWLCNLSHDYHRDGTLRTAVGETCTSIATNTTSVAQMTQCRTPFSEDS